MKTRLTEQNPRTRFLRTGKGKKILINGDIEIPTIGYNDEVNMVAKNLVKSRVRISLITKDLPRAGRKHRVRTELAGGNSER